MDNLKKAISYAERESGYRITFKGTGSGRLIVGRKGSVKIAYIYADNVTQALHELGHLLSTKGPRPISLLSQLIRELEAWRTSECLHHKFDVPFDEQVFDEGLNSYVIELMASNEKPSYEWLSQLLGGIV